MLTIILAYYYAQILSGNVSKEIIKDYLVAEAMASNLNPQMVVGIVEAESNFNCNAVGDKGKSFGCWQIHKPTEKRVRPLSVEDAKNIIKSTTWSIQTIKEDGSCRQWSTCNQVMKKISHDST